MRKIGVYALFIFFVFSPFNLIANNSIRAVPDEGRYKKNQTVRFTVDQGSIEYKFRSNNYFIPWKAPLELSAVEGQEITYTIEVRNIVRDEVQQSKIYTYTIDKKSPTAPNIQPKEGFYNSSVNLRFSLKNSSNSVSQQGNAIRFAITGLAGYEKEQKWDGKDILLKQDEYVADYNILAYSVDNAGNKSRIVKSNIKISGKENIENKYYLDVKSPVKGNFANRQLLFIESSNMDWIRYTLDGSDPVNNGMDYSKPEILDVHGDVILKIAAKKIDKEDIIRKTVSFRIVKSSASFSQLESKVTDKSLTLNFDDIMGNKIYYSFSDDIKKENFLPLKDNITIKPINGLLRYIPLSFRLYNEKEKIYSPVFRYSYILEGRKPSAPIISFSNKNNMEIPSEIVLYGAPRYSVHYTLDGTEPKIDDPLYQEPIKIEWENFDTNNNLIIKAAAFTNLGTKGITSEKTFQFSQEKPSAPSVHVDHTTYQPGGALIEITGNKNTKCVYEVSIDKGEPSAPTYNSPEAQSPIELHIPYGMQRSYTFSFASVNQFGAVSDNITTINVTLDRLPPQQPGIDFKNGTITLDGKENIHYLIVPRGSTNIGNTFSNYTEPILISNLSNIQNNGMWIFSYSSDNAGNRSKIIGPFPIPASGYVLLPEYNGVTDGEIINSNQVRLRFDNPENIIVLYEYTQNGEDPPTPNNSSMSTTNGIDFTCDVNEEKIIKLAMRPYDSIRDEYGNVKTLQFKMDRKKPKLPSINGVVNNASYNKRISITIEPKSEKDTIFYMLSGIPLNNPEIIKNGKVYKREIVCNIKNGSEKNYYLYTGVKDNAGNINLVNDPFMFTIDKTPPDSPEPKGIPAYGLSGQDITITFPKKAGETIYYSLKREGGMPTLSGAEAKRYSGPIRLKAENGNMRRYSFQAISMDKAGNESNPTRIYNITIDKRDLPPPGKPQYLFENNFNNMTLYWDMREESKKYENMDGELFYQIQFDNGTIQKQIKYSDITSISIPEGTKDITVQYWNTYGNVLESEKKSIDIDIPLRLKRKSLIQGITDGGKYNKDITIKPYSGWNNLRYEIGVEDNVPNVSLHSPSLQDTLHLEALAGRKTTYTIKVAAFSTSGSVLLSRTYNITIDNEPPPPPQIKGVKDGEYYQENKQATLETEEGKIMYAVTSGTQPSNDQFRQFSKPIQLEANKGGFASYNIYAYTIDNSGNRSAQTKLWKIFIDKGIIYVAPNGNDEYAGTRTHPFKTLSKALEFSAVSYRKTIYLAEGTYDIHKTVNITNEIHIVGGCNKNTWEIDTSSKSIIKPGRYFKEKSTLFDLRGSSVIFENISFKDESSKVTVFFNSEGTDLSIKKSVFLLNNITVSAIKQKFGTLTVHNSIFQADTEQNISIIEMNKGVLHIEKAEIKNINNPKIVKLVTANNSPEFTITNSILSPGKGGETTAVYANNSNIIFENAAIYSGIGSSRSYAARISQGKIAITDGTLLKGEDKARLTTVFYGEDISLRLSRSTIAGSARNGSTGIYINKGTVDIEAGKITMENPEDFQYPLKLNNVSGLISNTYLFGGNSVDYIGLDIKNSDINIYQNTFIHGTGDNSCIGLKVEGNTYPRFINNIHGRNGKECGIAIQITGIKPDNKLLGNNLAGWENIYVEKNEKGETITEIREIRGFNIYDDNPFKGPIDGNIAEPLNKSLTTVEDIKDKENELKLKEDSACVNGGFNIINFGGIPTDREGQIRPNPDMGYIPKYDIGADEFYYTK